MMGGNGFAMGGMWLFGLLTFVAIVLLVVLAVRYFAGGVNRDNPRRDGHKLSGQDDQSTARQILDERYARGELTDDKYVQHRRILGEER